MSKPNEMSLCMHKEVFTEEEIKAKAEQVLRDYFLWEIEKRSDSEQWNIKIASPRVGFTEGHCCSGWRGGLGLMEWLDGFDCGISSMEEKQIEL